MIGRAAHGRPWIFREIEARLGHDCDEVTPSPDEQRDIMLHHLRDLHAFYGEEAGVRVARKHIDWYAKSRASAPALRQAVMQATDASIQIERVQAYFDALEEAPEEVLSSAA
jgi:tRNA-dihydrouridine synthase B